MSHYVGDSCPGGHRTDAVVGKANYHELKAWPASFEAVWSGKKTAEFRRNDRDFQEGDWLRLREWLPLDEDGEYTGAELGVTITDIQRGPDWGIPEGYAVLSIKIVKWGVGPISHRQSRGVSA